MASLGVGFILPAVKPTSSSSSLGARSRGRHASVVTVGATRGTGTGTAAAGAKEEKNLLEWVLGALVKDDQLLETDPILKKVEDKTAPRSRTGPVSTPAPKTNGGFGGLGGPFGKK